MVKPTAITYGLASAASVATLAIAYFPFYWILIQLQTWRLGHPNPFTIGPGMDAVPCSCVAALIAFGGGVVDSATGVRPAQRRDAAQKRHGKSTEKDSEPDEATRNVSQIRTRTADFSSHAADQISAAPPLHATMAAQTANDHHGRSAR